MLLAEGRASHVCPLLSPMALRWRAACSTCVPCSSPLAPRLFAATQEAVWNPLNCIVHHVKFRHHGARVGGLMSYVTCVADSQ